MALNPESFSDSPEELPPTTHVAPWRLKSRHDLQQPQLPEEIADEYDRLFALSPLALHAALTTETGAVDRVGRQLVRHLNEKGFEFDPHDEKLGDRRAGGPSLGELDPKKPL